METRRRRNGRTGGAVPKTQSSTGRRGYTTSAGDLQMDVENAALHRSNAVDGPDVDNARGKHSANDLIHSRTLIAGVIHNMGELYINHKSTLTQ